MFETAVVRVDQQPDWHLPKPLCEQGAGAFVVQADPSPLPPLALNQPALPGRVRLTHVVPEPGQEGDLLATET